MSPAKKKTSSRKKTAKKSAPKKDLSPGRWKTWALLLIIVVESIWLAIFIWSSGSLFPQKVQEAPITPPAIMEKIETVRQDRQDEQKIQDLLNSHGSKGQSE